LAVVSSSLDYLPPPQPVPVASDEDFVPLPVREGAQGVSKPTGPTASGAWGSRSFASTLSSPSPGRNQPTASRAEENRTGENDWDLDELWNDLQQRSGGKQKKLVILGGNGGRRQ